MDVRSGGSSLIVMSGPNGEEVPNPGLYLEVVPNKRLVFTDAFTSTWVPAGKPFMVGDITFEDLGDGTTRYTAIARHWSVEDRKTHEQMGFHEGWGVAADQMAGAGQDAVAPRPSSSDLFRGPRVQPRRTSSSGAVRAITPTGGGRRGPRNKSEDDGVWARRAPAQPHAHLFQPCMSRWKWSWCSALKSGLSVVMNTRQAPSRTRRRNWPLGPGSFQSRAT
jgi:hypothetical protein